MVTTNVNRKPWTAYNMPQLSASPTRRKGPKLPSAGAYSLTEYCYRDDTGCYCCAEESKRRRSSSQRRRYATSSTWPTLTSSSITWHVDEPRFGLSTSVTRPLAASGLCRVFSSTSQLSCDTIMDRCTGWDCSLRSWKIASSVDENLRKARNWNRWKNRTPDNTCRPSGECQWRRSVEIIGVRKHGMGRGGVRERMAPSHGESPRVVQPRKLFGQNHAFWWVLDKEMCFRHGLLVVRDIASLDPYI